jgi:hypothetical protein
MKKIGDDRNASKDGGGRSTHLTNSSGNRFSKASFRTFFLTNHSGRPRDCWLLLRCGLLARRLNSLLCMMKDRNRADPYATCLVCGHKFWEPHIDENMEIELNVHLVVNSHRGIAVLEQEYEIRKRCQRDMDLTASKGRNDGC